MTPGAGGPLRVTDPHQALANGTRYDIQVRGRDGRRRDLVNDCQAANAGGAG